MATESGAMFVVVLDERDARRLADAESWYIAIVSMSSSSESTASSSSSSEPTRASALARETLLDVVNSAEDRGASATLLSRAVEEGDRP